MYSTRSREIIRTYVASMLIVFAGTLQTQTIKGAL